VAERRRTERLFNEEQTKKVDSEATTATAQRVKAPLFFDDEDIMYIEGSMMEVVADKQSEVCMKPLYFVAN